MNEDGQADSAPVDEMAGLVDLLLNNPDVDSAQDRQSDGSVIAAEDDDAAALELLGNRRAQRQDNDEAADLAEQGNDPRSMDTFTPDGESLSPNGGRRIGLQPRDDANGRFAPARQGEGQFRVTSRDAAGKETVRLVDENERGAGYLRHDDYTRKMQELGNQRHEAVTVMDRKLSETHAMALDAVHKAQAVVVSLAKLPTPQQLAELAAVNPQAAMSERLRVDAVNAEIAKFDQMADAIRAKAVADAQAAQQQRFDICFAELMREGKNGVPMTREEVIADLTPLFESIIADFGIPRERFAKIDDPKLIRIFRKADAMVKLEAMAAERGTPQAAQRTAAPAPSGRRVPQQRQTGSQASRAARELDSRFQRRQGARTDDLAAWILRNNA